MAIHTSVATSTADSYISVAYANTYFNERIYSSMWDNIYSNSTGTLGATTQKERLLKQATREIDRVLRFNETKYYTDDIGGEYYQSLQFPRSSNIDADNNLYIPDEVKFATCEQALWIMERAQKKTTNDGATVERQTIGQECLEYLKPWITRSVQSYGNFGWSGIIG